jgi:hypothetical protein
VTEAPQQRGLDSNQQKQKRDLACLYSEFRRKHRLIFSVWAALDTKIGILLGLIVIVLLEITVNTEVINSLITNVHLLWPLSLTPISEINTAAFVLFWFAFGFFIAATIIGTFALRSKRFEDIETIEEANDFLNDPSMTNEIFIERMVRLLYDYIQLNEIRAKEKSRSIKWMVGLFFLGTVSFIMRFVVLVLCNF